MDLSVDLDLLRGCQRRGISPVPSTALRRALDLAGDERTNNDLLIEHIESSVSLRLGFMTGANLPTFCPGHPIRSVRQAVCELGRRKVLSLFWLLVLSDFFQSGLRRAAGNDSQFGALNRLWRHSLLTGVLARQLVRAGGFDFHEAALTAGLAHDIGHFLLAHSEPRLGIAFEAEQKDHDGLYEHEVSAAPERDHCRLGASLLQFWNAPTDLVSCALFHHDPERANDEQRPLIIGLRLADLLAEHLELDQPTPVLRVKEVPAWRHLTALEPWNQVTDLHRQVLEQLPDAMLTAEYLARVLQ